jgi:hypothetical protein
MIAALVELHKIISAGTEVILAETFTETHSETDILHGTTATA